MMGMRSIARAFVRSIVVVTVVALGIGNLPAAADPVKITAKDHEGQRKVDGVLADYTSGNITTYAERDTINFRFDLAASHGPSSGDLEVRFTGHDGTCLFFDDYFVLGAIENIGGDEVPTITVASGPTAVDFGTSSGEWVVTLHIDYPQTFDHTTNEVQVNYQLRLSDEAGACSGSSQHSRLNPAGGVVVQTGAQNVPVPANQVIELGQITAQKVVDSGTATPDQWCFNISPNPQNESLPKCPAPGEDTVVFTGLPTGDYTVTETNVAGYRFASGDGTNCTFTGSVGTASVVAAPDPTDATCIFHNEIVPGQITLNKTENGGAPTRTFTFTLTGPNGFSDTQTTTVADPTLLWGDLEPGTYQLCETVPEGFSSSLGPVDPNTGQACGAPFELAAGGDLTFNVNNIPCPDGSLTISRQIPAGSGPATFTYTIDRPAPLSDQQVQLVFGTNDTFKSTTISTSVAGNYTVSETAPSRFTPLSPITVAIQPPDCAATAAFVGDLAPVPPAVRVIKTEQLTPSSPKRAARGKWTFYLIGPDTDPNTPGVQGDIVTKRTNSGGARNRLNWRNLAEGDYRLCEKFFGGWRSNLGGADAIVLPNGDRCVDFSLTNDELAVFRVNNRCPSGGFAPPR